MTESRGHARLAWKSRPDDDFDPHPASVAGLARSARLRAGATRAAMLLVAIATLGWAIYLVPSGGFAALPWALIGGASAAEWWKRGSHRAAASIPTTEFMRQELIRDIDDSLRLAGWRGYALLLGVMWLVIGTRVLADGVSQAFATRGIPESVTIAILAPVVISALIHVVWRWHLRGKAKAMQRELAYLELLGPASGGSQ